MTRQKHLKNRIRARMQKTGERYSAARRHILAGSPPQKLQGPQQFHLPGNVPATTALRVSLSAAQLQPESGPQQLSEAMLFGIAGGVGAGVFAFRYEKEDFSSFFIAGRHLWQDDQAYLESACQRLGVDVEVKETGGAKTAEKQLREMLAFESPVVAWVDMAGLPRHVFPNESMGGLYHVITVYGIDDDTSEAIIGDLTDGPERIPLDALSKARLQIRKQKNRLMRISGAPAHIDLKQAVFDGIAACHDTLIGRGAVKTPGGKSMASNFTLDAFAKLAKRMHGSDDKQSWSTMFPRGIHFWRGLTSLYSFIHYGTGGGLTRPLYAEFFREAHRELGVSQLKELGDRYEDLGHGWDNLGDAALPNDITVFSRFQQLSVERAELTLSGDRQAFPRLVEIANELAELEKEAADSFPLTESEAIDLRADLKQRVESLNRDERDAHSLLGELASAVR